MSGGQDDQDQARPRPRPQHAGFAVRRVAPPEPDEVWLAPAIYNDGITHQDAVTSKTLGSTPGNDDSRRRSGRARGSLAADMTAAAQMTAQLSPGIEAFPSAAVVGKVEVKVKVKGPVGPDTQMASRLAAAKREALEGCRKKKGQGRTDQAEPDVARAAKQADYLKRGAGFLQRYCRQNKIAPEHEDIDPVDLVIWFLSLKNTVAPSSWRMYRRAMIATVQIMPHSRVDEALLLIEADVGVESDEARSKQRGRRGGGTPLPRARAIPKDHLDRMVGDVTIFSRSKHAPILGDWLVAGVNTGLRPTEWALAALEVRQDPTRISGRRAWLHVVNASATDGHAIDVSRTLDISDFSDETFGAVERLVRVANQWSLEQFFSAGQSGCQQICYEMSFALFPRLGTLYSLYTLRHQFIANMSRVYDRETVAALVGQVTVATDVEHYARRCQGWMDHDITERPSAMPDRVGQARKIMNYRDKNMAVRTARRRLADRKARAPLDGEEF